MDIGLNDPCQPSPTTRREQMEEKLQLYTKVFENLDEGIIITDPNGVILTVNPAFTKTTGYSEEEVIGKSPRLLQSRRHDAEFYMAMWSSLLQTGRWQGEIWNRRKNGEIYPEWLSINTIKNEQGEVTNYVGIFFDLTSQKQQEEQLRLYKQVFEHTSEGIMITDTAGTILYVNPAFTATTGYSRQEAIGRKPNMLQSKLHDRQFYARMWTAIGETGTWQGEVWNQRKNGEIYPEWLNISSVRNEKGEITHYVGSFSDITERKKSEEHLKFLAHYDVLTELPNRFLFKTRLNEAIEEARKFGKYVVIMFLDLDRFKNMNDTFGHSFGDQLLQQFAKRLKKCVRKTDTVARLAGDEFTVLLPAIDDLRVVHRIAQDVFKIMCRPFRIEGMEFYLTTSIGISVYPNDGQDMETLIKNADAAMYLAKESGNTYQFFSSDIREAISSKYWLENSLHKALEREEFVIHYQPQVEVQTGEMVSMEALLRWNHPERGLIAPGEFIPLAEETGLIVPIGEWILFTVCRQNKAWQDAGYAPVKVAVNLSVRQLQDPLIIPTLERVLRETRLDPSYLVLEITESINIQPIQTVMKTIQDIRERGIEVSIDDFGTGNSSLGYLREYEVDALKIDRSFVKGVMTNRRKAAIVRAMIELAEGLDLKIIAEGVETEEELAFFKQSKCRTVQGFYFSRPVPAEGMEAFLQERKIV